MHPYSNTSITPTGIIGKNSENYGDLTDHDLSHQVYVDRPMMTPLQPWMAANTPNEHTQSNYNQMYNNNASFMSSSPSSSSSVSTSCMPSISNAYPPPLVGGASPALPSLSSSRSQSQQPPLPQQQQQHQQHRNNNMISDTYAVPNHNHSEYHASMTSGYHSYKQEYSPSPSPPLHHRSNSIASDSSNDEREHSSRSGGGKVNGKKREKALERNRQAALRCRQRKKEWLNQLQSNVEVLTKQNRVLEQQSLSLREEILNLKTILLAHRDCSHAHITAGSINVDNLLYRSSPTTSAATSSSPTISAKTTNSSS